MNKGSMRIKILDDGKYLQINETTIFPAIYLRDNCPDSFHSTTFQREVPVWDLPCDLRIQNAKFLANDRVQITYSDGYVSGMPLHFFDKNSFHFAAGQAPPKLQLWNAKYLSASGLPSYNFNDIIQKDKVLLSFLNTITSCGVAKISNCGIVPGQLEKLAQRFGFIRETNYGKIFEVRVEKNALNQAYTSHALPLHTDLPFYGYPPGIQLLHCLVQCKDMNGGGNSILADGLAIAQKMKVEMPRLYQRLVNSKVVFEDKANNGKFFMKYERAIIGECDGVPCEIHYNDHVRSTELNVALDDVEEFYDAIREFGKLAHSPEFMYETRLQQGEILAFSNKRVLHGRRAIVTFNQASNSERISRWLQGAYVDMDEVYSKQRCLDEAAGISCKL